MLSIDENDPVVEACESNGQWQAARIRLLAMDLSDFKQHDEPTEVFAHAVSARLRAVAGWLARQPNDAFEQASHSGMRLDLFFNPWIDDDQLDLDLPSVLFLECGKPGITPDSGNDERLSLGPTRGSSQRPLRGPRWRVDEHASRWHSQGNGVETPNVDGLGGLVEGAISPAGTFA